MSDAFDPDAYLAQKAAAFDPDAYLAARAPDTKPSGPVTLDASTTGALHASRHLAFGLGDKITAAIQSLSELRHDKTGKTFGELYDNNLAFNDKLLENSDAAHSTARWVGNGIGLGGNIAALGGVAPLRALLASRGVVPAAARAIPAATMFGRALQGASEGVKVGVPLGAVGGFGAARGDSSLSGTLLGAGVGGLTGGLLGGAGGTIGAKLAARQLPTSEVPKTLAELAQETGQSLPMAARGITPDPEAQVLQRYGVPLTLGQMQPGGVASEVEEAASRVPMLGKAIEGQRKAAEGGWRNAVVDQSRSPVEGPFGRGAGPEGELSTIEKLQQIKQGFHQAYDQIADRPAAALAAHPETGELVHPREAFEAILKDPSYQASDSDLSVARRLLEDQTGKLERMQEAGQPVKAGLLMNMRSHLRDAAQDARLNGNHSTSQMFQDAADSIGGGIRGTLPERDLGLLDKTDAAYSRFMKVVGAAKRAGRNAAEGEFGPKHLSAELEKSYGSRFATDAEAGGSLRELSRAGKYAFTPREPMTGHGETLKSALGTVLGSQVFRANQDPATQRLFMLAAQRAAENAPRSIAPAAGDVERTLAQLLGRVPASAATASPAATSLLDFLRGGGQ